MTDPELLEALAALGVTPETWRAALLLPLVEVAWADGAVQAPERTRILAVAGEHGLLDGPAGPVVRRWLETRPDEAVTALGRRVVVALAHRHRGPGADLGTDALADVARQCVQVARAAGGLFDLAFTVDQRERDAIAAITAALRAGSEALRDDLPDPEGGSFRDL